MAINKRIANLSAALTADTRDYEAGMKRAASATASAQASIGRSMGGLEKVGLKLGLGLVGSGGALAMLTSEIRNVIANIEKIPGVPQETIDSVNRTKLAFSQTRDVLDRGISTAVGFVTDKVQGLGFAIGGLVYGLDNAETAEKEFAEEADRAAKASLRIADAAKAEAESVKRATAAQEKHTASVKKFNDEMAAYADAESGLKSAEDEYFRLGETDSERISRLQSEAAALRLKAAGERASNNATAAMKLETEAWKKLTEAQRDQNAQYKEHESGQAARTESELNSFFGELDDKSAKGYEDRIRKTEELARESEKLSSILEDGFTQAIMEGRDFNDVLDGIGKSIINMVLQKSIIGPLANMITGGITSLFGGFFAEGGRPPMGKVSVVGERGPELFVPDSAGTVVPNGGAGGGNTYYVDARGTDESVIVRLGQALQQLAGPGVVERRAMAAVSDNMRRGGSFA